jgi:O-antigen ligase
LTTLALVFQRQLFAVLGKSEDLTGRVDIWAAVTHLAQQRPVAGWGWVSYWVPWVAPFDTLVTRNGVRQLHAHNAWIDVWFQLGIIGLIFFGALVASSVVRSWWLAVDRPQSGPGDGRNYTVESALALLVLTALLVQSIAESRLLVEFGFFFLVVVAVKTKSDRSDAVT